MKGNTTVVNQSHVGESGTETKRKIHIDIV